MSTSFSLGSSKLIANSNWPNVKATLKNALKAISEKVANAGAGLLESSPYIVATSTREPRFNQRMPNTVRPTPSQSSEAALTPKRPTSQDFQANFRDNNFITEYLQDRTSKQPQTDQEVIQQIERDQGRYDGLTNMSEIVTTVESTPDTQIRQNILFGCCQKFELALKDALHLHLYGPDTKYALIQTGDQKSIIKCDTTNKTTEITCQLKVRYHIDDKQVEYIDAFKATAIFNWNTADVSMQITRPQ